MALTPASRNWASIARKALGASAVTAVALVALAIPASAHTGSPEADCTKDNQHAFLEIHLSAYKDDNKNTIAVTDGDTVLVSKTTFGARFDYDKSDFDGTVAHHFTVTVVASDNERYNINWKKTVPVCKKEQPPTSSSHPSTPPSHPSTPPSSVVAAPVTTTTVAAVGVSANLASTGASVGVPLAIAALLLVGGVGMLFLVRKRRKA